MTRSAQVAILDVDAKEPVKQLVLRDFSLSAAQANADLDRARDLYNSYLGFFLQVGHYINILPHKFYSGHYKPRPLLPHPPSILGVIGVDPFLICRLRGLVLPGIK